MNVQNVQRLIKKKKTEGFFLFFFFMWIEVCFHWCQE